MERGDEKYKGTPRTNTRKVVCSECGVNINRDNKIIHSERRHPEYGFIKKIIVIFIEDSGTFIHT